MRDHSLYVAFAPVDSPQVALAVVVENSGFGAEAAAPMARRVLDYLLMGQYPSREDLEKVKIGKVAAPIGISRVAREVPLPMTPNDPLAVTPQEDTASAPPAMPASSPAPVRRKKVVGGSSSGPVPAVSATPRRAGTRATSPPAAASGASR